MARPEVRDRQVRAIAEGNSMKPNKPETIILELLDKLYPNEWAFVGDGKIIIGGLIPDFININGQKKIIEFFGEYWHGEEKVRAEHQTEEGRIKAYAEFGYKTLVIWENELEDMDKVAGKIMEFAS